MTVAIRPSVAADRPVLEAMARLFVASSPYHAWLGVLKFEGLEQLLAALGDNAIIYVAEDPLAGVFGMIVMIATPHVLNGLLVAEEMAWWVNPSHRGAVRAGPRLLSAAEDWARSRKCYMVKMVAPIPSGVGRFYARLGYTAIETAYAKVIESVF